MRDVILLLFLGASLIAALRYPYAAVLLWAWFTLAAPQQGAWGAVALPLNLPIVAIAIGSIIYHGDIFRLRWSAQLIFIVAFTLWLFVAQAYSLAPEISAIHFDRFWKVMLFVIIVSVATTDRLRFMGLLWILILVIGFFGAKGGMYTFQTLGKNIYFGTDGTVLGDNNHVGIAMAACLPLILFAGNYAVNRWTRMLTWIVFGLTLVAIFGTYSRGAFISLVAFGGLLWLYSRHKVLIAATAIGLAVIALAAAPGEWTNRMESITEADEDSSFLARVDAWVINWELAKANPITGAGLRTSYEPEVASLVVTDREPRAAHSIYFEILGGTGFVGLFLFLAFYASGVISALRTSFNKSLTPWRRDFGRYSAMSLIVFAIGGSSVSMEMWEGYLIILVLANAVGTLPDKVRPLGRPKTPMMDRIRERAANSRDADEVSA